VTGLAITDDLIYIYFSITAVSGFIISTVLVHFFPPADWWIGGFYCGLYATPHQVEASARLKKKEASYEDGLS
jgi:hypothetical protein